MKLIIKLSCLSTLFLSLNAFSHANLECTDKPQKEWLQPIEMQKKIINEYGFAIQKFYKTGSCYEVYGWGLSEDGKKYEEIEAYFNPVTGEILKKKIKD